MRWKYLVSITLLAYVASQAVFAQPTAGSNAQTPDNTAQSADQNQAPVVDSGGNLQVAPSPQQPMVIPQAPPDQGMAQPSQRQQPAPDSVNVAPGSTNEYQEPSNPNQSMIPATPDQQSVPASVPGSMQN